MLLAGKVAIVTGSGRGIGREEALLMAKHGAYMSDGTAIGQECGGHGMAQHMGIHSFANPRSPSILMKAFPRALGFQPYRIFPLRDEKC